MTNTNTDELTLLFNMATTFVKSIIGKLSNQQMLEFYGFYKQAVEGPCNKQKPHWYEISEKQKWEAWMKLGNLNSEVAKRNYIDLLYTVDPYWLEKPMENSQGWVHHSCMKNDDEFISEDKKTIFDWVKENNVEKVKAHGQNLNFDINMLDDSGLSLLHWAADRGNADIVRYLIGSLKASVNVQDNTGQTPLHYAVSCENEDVVKYLMEAGADVNIKDNDGQGPYDCGI